MNAQAVLKELERLGKPNTVKIYVRHGITGPCYGVNYGDLRPLVKRIGRNHDVALGLWDSGVHDARVVAHAVRVVTLVDGRVARDEVTAGEAPHEIVAGVGKAPAIAGA